MEATDRCLNANPARSFCSAPLYKLVTTDLGGEKRFASAVARRLQSLGALTRGDRRAASGVDLSEWNIDSPLGRKVKIEFGPPSEGAPLLQDYSASGRVTEAANAGIRCKLTVSSDAKCERSF